MTCPQKTQLVWNKVKVASAILFVIAFVFALCIDIFFMNALPSEGLAFVLCGLAAAFIADLTIQLILIGVLSAAQHCSELKGKTLPLKTRTLQLMNKQAKDIARHVF